MEEGRLSSHAMWEAGYAGVDPTRGSPPYASPETRVGTFEVVRAMREALPDAEGLHLLEMGCGGSKYLPWMAREMRMRVDGIDYSEAGCRCARWALDAVGAQGDIHCEDFMNLPAGFRGRYDVVTSFGVVEHFEDTADVLGRFAAALKPGGLMVTFVPNMRSLAGKLIGRLDPPLFATHKLFTLGEFVRHHERAGLQVSKALYTEWMDFELLPLHGVHPVLSLATKNVVHYVNRTKHLLYRVAPSFQPQSDLLCSGMLVIARRPSQDMHS